MYRRTRPAFTLIEVLIGVIIMAIVISGIAMSIRMGIDLYGRAEAHSEVIRGMRFTLDSFSRTISPLLHTASQVEILSIDASEIPPASGDEHYIFKDGEALIHRTKHGDSLLPGSEYIKMINFYIPSGDKPTADNYTLKLSISHAYENGYGASQKIDILEALYNKPAKSYGNGSSGNAGSVLRFVAIQDLSLFWKVTPKLYTADGWHKVDNTPNLPIGNNIAVSYDAILLPHPDADSETASEKPIINWYISESAATPENGVIPSSQHQLLDREGNPISSDVLYTSGDKSVLRDGNKFKLSDGEEWALNASKSFYIRALITMPQQTDSGTPITSAKIWSPYISFSRPGAAADGGMWQDWLSGADGFKKTEVSAEGGHVKITTDNTNMKITIQAGNTKKDGAATVAKLDYKYMNNDKIYKAWQNYDAKTTADIPSYITMTNYSIIMEYQTQSNIQNLWLFLSTSSGNEVGWENNSTTEFKDIGYALQICQDDKRQTNGESKGFSLCCYEANNAQPMLQEAYGIQNVTNNDRAYAPENLMNKEFTKWTYEEKHRILVSVLEYYTDDKNNPKYIIRARFLKEATSSTQTRLEDPWCTGPDFFFSEPMWFGLPVGSRLYSTNSTTYQAPVRHYFGNYWNNTNPQECLTTGPGLNDADATSSLFYGLKQQKIENSAPKDVASTVFKTKELNPKNAVNVDSDRVLSNPKRNRYIGLHASQKSNSNNSVTIYNVELAPGFSADEIKSIMPANGKMYEISDTISEEEFQKISQTDWYASQSGTAKDVNKRLFGVSSTGNSTNKGENGLTSIYYNQLNEMTKKYSIGLYGLQHVPGTNCPCPLHNEFYKWLAPAVKLPDPKEIIRALHSMTYDPSSQIYKFFDNTTEQAKTLNSGGINYAVNAVVNECRSKYGYDLSSTSWRIYRKKIVTTMPPQYYYNIFWSPIDIAGLASGDSFECYRWGGAEDTATKIFEDKKVEKGTANVKPDNPDGVFYMNTIYNWAPNK